MATSTFPATGGFVDNTSAATFVPEIWSDEIRAAYEKNLILANLVKKMSMSGKKGDTIHIPAPIRGAAYAKAENTAVTVQNDTESEVQVVIDKHYEYSRIIEDITEVQALASLRNFYTGDAGYALSRQVDNDLFQLGKSLGDGDGSAWANSAVYYNDASTGLTRNAIMGIDRYVSSDFVGGQVVQNGKIGNLYGIDVYVSSNCPIIEFAANNSAGGDIKAAMLIHQDTLILAEQVGVRSQTQYKQEFLGTLYTADTLYGVKAYRPDSGFVLAVNG
jgi:hypothetical protein